MEMRLPGSRGRCRFRSDILVIDEALNPRNNSVGDDIRVTGQDGVIFVQKTGFDNGSRGAGVDLLKRVVIGHVRGDAVGVEWQAGNAAHNGHGCKRPGGWTGSGRGWRAPKLL